MDIHYICSFVVFVFPLVLVLNLSNIKRGRFFFEGGSSVETENAFICFGLQFPLGFAFVRIYKVRTGGRAGNVGKSGAGGVKR